ncbi:hypothetical protein FKM82_025364 [Ascaphus truei]
MQHSQGVGNENQIFNVEWRLNREQKETVLVIFSAEDVVYSDVNYTHRIYFVKPNFSTWLHNLTVQEEGTYTQLIRLLNGTQLKTKMLVTVTRPVSNVTVSSSSSCPHAGGNVTLSCEKMQGTAVTYTWHLCQKPLMEGERIILSPDNASLTLTNLQEFDVGIYRCVARTRVNEEHKDFALQLCQAERHYRSWDYYGYFGYPGYLGYFLIILFVCKKTRKVKKRNSNRGIFITTSLRSPQCLSNLS